MDYGIDIAGVDYPIFDVTGVINDLDDGSGCKPSSSPGGAPHHELFSAA
jgi:hypothetical protein